MKKLLTKTILSAGLLASITPMCFVASCNNAQAESISEDYTSAIPAYEPTDAEKAGVTYDEAIAIFLKAENCEKIYLEDTKDIIAKLLKQYKAISDSSANLKLTNISINKNAKTISFDIYFKLVVGENTINYGTVEVNAKVENVPLCGYSTFTGYTIQVTPAAENGSWLENSKITGSVSGKWYDAHDKELTQYTGQQKIITKSSTFDTDMDVICGAMCTFTGCSHYLSKLTYKPS